MITTWTSNLSNIAFRFKNVCFKYTFDVLFFYSVSKSSETRNYTVIKNILPTILNSG